MTWQGIPFGDLEVIFGQPNVWATSLKSLSVSMPCPVSLSVRAAKLIPAQ